MTTMPLPIIMYIYFQLHESFHYDCIKRRNSKKCQRMYTISKEEYKISKKCTEGISHITLYTSS